RVEIHERQIAGFHPVVVTRGAVRLDQAVLSVSRQAGGGHCRGSLDGRPRGARRPCLVGGDAERDDRRQQRRGQKNPHSGLSDESCKYTRDRVLISHGLSQEGPCRSSTFGASRVETNSRRWFARARRRVAPRAAQRTSKNS